MADAKDTLTLKISGKKKRTLKIKHGIWADLKGLHVDGRTRVGKWMDHLRVELIRHVGGEPSVAESILIEQIVIKTLKAHLYHVGLFKDKAFGSKDHVLAIQNSIRLDLQALGLQRRKKKVLDLSQYLQSKKEESYESSGSSEG
jgi:hypothetical protein